MTESISLDLNPEETFYTYHTLCTYLLGDYPLPRYETGATTEDIRRVASKIETGTDEVQLSPTEAHALAKAYSSVGQDTPLNYPFAEVRND